MNILIPTIPNDMHAIYAHLALKNLNCDSTLWYIADFPKKDVHSFEINSDNFSWIMNQKQKMHDFSVVWLRRPKGPISSDILHKEDRKRALKESWSFYNAFLNNLNSTAFWINPEKSRKQAACKILQLKLARAIGLNVPKTLVSNDSKTIKDFIKDNIDKKIIYKSFNHIGWVEENKLKLTYTSVIESEDLPDDLTLQNVPGIFQIKIPKEYEVRVTYMGHQYIAVKLNSQIHPCGLNDWRAIPLNELTLERVTLPKYIDDKCKQLLRDLDIVFGCFDFIVTPNEEYFFLELNEQGQFLWIEQLNPEIKMLDAFINFMISKSSHFQWNENEAKIDLSSFNEEAEEINNHAIKQHLDAGSFYQ